LSAPSADYDQAGRGRILPGDENEEDMSATASG
jgi:hypothetical protein